MKKIIPVKQDKQDKKKINTEEKILKRKLCKIN